MIWTTVDTEALRLWLVKGGIPVSTKTPFTTWMRRRGVEPVGYERRGRSRMALWDIRDVDAAFGRLTVTHRLRKVKTAA